MTNDIDRGMEWKIQNKWFSSGCSEELLTIVESIEQQDKEAVVGVI